MLITAKRICSNSYSVFIIHKYRGKVLEEFCGVAEDFYYITIYRDWSARAGTAAACIAHHAKMAIYRSISPFSNEGGDSEWLINYLSYSIRKKCVESMSIF